MTTNMAIASTEITGCLIVPDNDTLICISIHKVIEAKHQLKKI